MKKIAAYIISIAMLSACANRNVQYYTSNGFIQGTSYHIIYKNNSSLSDLIDMELHKFDTSLSAYIAESTISKINNNQIESTTDTMFLKCLSRALQISELTHGAMDITVSQIVNAWGFGFNHEGKTDKHTIDSLLEFCNYRKIHIDGNRVIKDDKRLQLNANCIAQGQSVDVIAELFEQMGIFDYMVEIGGEVRANGLNAKGVLWRIGIDKPIEDSTAQSRELQEIVSLNNMSLSTSGNYRKFHVENGIKYSHTINPATGFPVQNGLLSASILGPDCITTDALATACMVMGTEAAAAMCDTLPDIEYYLIYSDTTGSLQTLVSDGFSKIILDR